MIGGEEIDRALDDALAVARERGFIKRRGQIGKIIEERIDKIKEMHDLGLSWGKIAKVINDSCQLGLNVKYVERELQDRVSRAMLKRPRGPKKGATPGASGRRPSKGPEDGGGRPALAPPIIATSENTITTKAGSVHAADRKEEF